MEHGVYRDLIIVYPKPYSIYFRGNIGRGDQLERSNLLSGSCRSLNNLKYLGPGVLVRSKALGKRIIVEGRLK